MWPKTKSLYNLYIAIVLLQFALFIQKVFHDALICRFLHFLSGLDVKVLLWKDNVLVAHPLKDFFMSLIWNWKFTWYAAVFALIFSNVYIYTLPKKNTSKTSLSKVQWEEWKLQKIISTTYVKYSFQKQRKWSLLVTSNQKLQITFQLNPRLSVLPNYWNRFGEETKRPSNIETRCQHNCQIVDFVIWYHVL